MPILVNESNREFHIQGLNTSYIFTVLKNGQLGHLYYGKRIRHQKSFSHLLQLPNEPLGNATFPFKGDQTFSLEFIKQEFPSFGTSDFREPAIELEDANGEKIVNFQYESYQIVKGKPALDGLPAVYVEEEDEADTLIVNLVDSYLNVKLQLFYTVFHDRNVITRSSRIVNEGSGSINIHRLMSVCVDFPHDDYDFIHLDGAWIRERFISCNRLRNGIQSIDSKRGTSSSQHNPFFALKEVDANEHKGQVYGFSLVYSGNFLSSVEVDHYGTSRALMGINPFQFKWVLNSGQSFQSPEVVLVYSDQGLNGMSQTYHRLYESRLARGSWRNKVRPILINNWEATYFDFNEEKILSIAKEASKLGIELFVLDDGWFKGRNNDSTSLGDWTPDFSKLPNGIAGLSEKVNKEGIQFGLWVEPEMISEDSDLYRAHPDWVLGVNSRQLSHGRNQFILDLTKPEVRDYLIETLTHVLSNGNITYLKWDMNRNMTEIGSNHLSPLQQGEVSHRYILGLYEILDTLNHRFPEMLIESCASGGNRFDPGMLYYAPQTWASDNTDAIERLKIQYGTSIVYPVSSIGAHVSSVPNHQTGRITPLETRFNVAMFGAFGYELDATKLSTEDRVEVEKQIQFYQENREVIQFGTFYRLLSPFEGNNTAWMVTSEDKETAIFAFYKTLAQPNPKPIRVLLKGLHPDKRYQLVETGETFEGDELMNVGFLLPPFYNGTVRTPQTFLAGDYRSKIWKFQVVD